MFFDYARYYLTFGLQLLTATGLILGGPYAWLGLSTLFFFAVADELLPLDYAERRISNRRLANIPIWLCTVTGPLLVLLLAWTAAHGRFHRRTLVWRVDQHGLDVGDCIRTAVA